MKYFTREWFDVRNGSNFYELLNIAEEAETFSEEYFKILYQSKLAEHLKLYKEMSELTIDDIFPLNSWSNPCTIDKDGNFIEVSSMVSTEEFEKIKEDILRKEQEARDNYVQVVYDEEKLTLQFRDGRIDQKINYLELLLPQDILRDVADIRVLALDVVSKQIYDRLYQFCSQKEEVAFKIEKDFQDYYKLIYPQLPEKLQKNYGFHDCKITNFEHQGSEAILELDHGGGYSNVCKVIYHNTTLLEQEDIVGSTWVYDEIYILKEAYEFHAALQDEHGMVRYFTLRAADIDFITD